MYCIPAYLVSWYILYYSPTFVYRVTVVIKIFPVNLSQTKFEVQINYVSKFYLLNRHWEPLIGKTPVPLANLVCNLLYNLYCMQVNYIQAWSTLYSWLAMSSSLNKWIFVFFPSNDIIIQRFIMEEETDRRIVRQAWGLP